MIDVLEPRKEVICSLLEQGHSRKAITQILGLTYQQVTFCLLRAGIRYEADKSNWEEIAAAYKSGQTMEQIGERFGVTRARIQQLLKRQGLGRADRGLSEKDAAMVERKKNARLARMGHLDRRTNIHYGCSAAILDEINGGAPRSRDRSPAWIYINQKKNAVKRGVEWKMSLPEWWKLWQESGKWSERGRGDGKYCMARLGDSGAYEVGNVEIITCNQNASDSYLVNSAAARWEKNVLRPRNAFDYSPRQTQVAELMDQGLEYIAIAVRLGMTPKNAWQHVNNVSKKRALLHEKILADSERQCPSSLLATVEAPL